jgi:hypothetical protein
MSRLLRPDRTVFTDSEDILNVIGDVESVVGSNTSIVPTDEASTAKDKAFRSKLLSQFLPVSKSTSWMKLDEGRQKMWKIVKKLDDLIVRPYFCGEQVTTAELCGLSIPVASGNRIWPG